MPGHTPVLTVEFHGFEKVLPGMENLSIPLYSIISVIDVKGG